MSSLVESLIFSNSETESDESDESSSMFGDEIEDEQFDLVRSSTPCSTSNSEDEGPYSEEPIADEEWLKEYNREKKRIDEHNAELQNRIDGVTPVETWCRCGNCRVGLLQNIRECQCCQDLEGCVDVLKGDLVVNEMETPPSCITLHPGFSTVCLNRWSLRSASVKYKTEDGRRYRQTGSDDEYFRAVAYREFTQLVHGYLGPRRIPLPACVYEAIRK